MQFADGRGFAEVQILKEIQLALTHELYTVF